MIVEPKVREYICTTAHPAGCGENVKRQIRYVKEKGRMDKYEHDPESLRAAGLAYAVDQIVDLVTQDVAGVHLYTMNNAETAKYIHQATHALFNHQSLG